MTASEALGAFHRKEEATDSKEGDILLERLCCSTIAVAWPCPRLQKGQVKLSTCCFDDLGRPAVSSRILVQLLAQGAFCFRPSVELWRRD
jgi:hypothetical protein